MGDCGFQVGRERCARPDIVLTMLMETAIYASKLDRTLIKRVENKPMGVNHRLLPSHAMSLIGRLK